MLGRIRVILLATPLAAFAAPAGAAPAMFEASFIFHAWGNDISSGTWRPYPYLSNDWTAAPLGYDCQASEPYTSNGAPSPRYCAKSILRRGHPATGTWSRSVGTGTPPRITMQQSDFGVQLITDTGPQVPGATSHCCRGFHPTFPPYLQSFTYATFVNATGAFFAGGGAAAANGYVNKTGTTTRAAGTWRIRAGANAFGGVMGLLGRYGATGKYTVSGQTGTWSRTSSWNMVRAIGRSTADTLNPYSKTEMWYKWTVAKRLTATVEDIGSGTLWTTGQVGNFAKTGFYYTSLWRTGYDNRTPGGAGTIQLVTPTLTHWLTRWDDSHTAHIGILNLRVVPEPGAVVLLAAGVGVLLAFRRWSR